MHWLVLPLLSVWPQTPQALELVSQLTHFSLGPFPVLLPSQ